MAIELLETLKDAITAYTGLSPTTFFTVVALGLAVYYAVSGMFGGSSDHQLQQRSSSFEAMQPLPPPVQLGEVTDEELKAYDGTDPKKPLLMAIKGQIYDVSQSRMFYGPGGPYALFAGKDASRALAKMSFEEKDLNGDLTGLGVFELDALQDWEYKFMSKYAKVGSIKAPETVPDATTAEQPAESTAAQPTEPTADEPTELTAAEPAEPADHPKVTEDTQSENVATVTKEESSTTSEANKED
ncbi:membrane steroid-binding protein 1-like [Cynara cardunculus var. scolymus]|uniref:Cytochrome b5-like heme/steroid binding domain-containing protein n=1 Tax=Cynara cardunculus var. scolymus TaxID=59895 RepID=A0A103YJE4_CYNCS|nr:membrane steroid-binding protein 1-like [Cynara cardunculus var. scolymus]KVI10150.1 cytochrome b5-like heme/steroid binding domain-containing protein [Cynara cardunculus var. scolymus]